MTSGALSARRRSWESANAGMAAANKVAAMASTPAFANRFMNVSSLFVLGRITVLRRDDRQANTSLRSALPPRHEQQDPLRLPRRDRAAEDGPEVHRRHP